MHGTLRMEITNLDIVTLRRIEDAESRDAPTPPAFIDTLLRLSKLGYLCGDKARTVRVTARGRRFLSRAQAQRKA